MRTMFVIFVTAILVDNYVLSQFLGICPFLGVSKKLNSAVGMGIAVTLVMVIATEATWRIYTSFLYPDYTYLNTLVFILVIAALVQLLETAMKKLLPALYKALGVYLPLITTNCAVLGVAILNIDAEYTLGQSRINAFGAGLGFLLAMVLFSGVRQRLASGKVSKSFEGIPITLVAAAIVSLAFGGFSGMFE